MEINLLDIPIVIASVDKPAQRARQFELLKEVKARGFKTIKIYNGPRYDPYYVAVAETRLKIFSFYNWCPITILEDDACFTNDFKPNLIIPSDANLLYTGYCLTRKPHVVSASETELPDIARIWRCYGMHATTFLSRKSIRRYSRIMRYCVDRGLHPDLILIKRLKKFVLYAPIKPFVYQASNPPCSLRPVVFSSSLDQRDDCKED